jgi:hypothetical protein
MEMSFLETAFPKRLISGPELGNFWPVTLGLLSLTLFFLSAL